MIPVFNPIWRSILKNLIFVFLLGMPSAAFAEKEALQQYKFCLTEQFSFLGKSNIDRMSTKAEFVDVFENVIASRCWVENKMAAWEAAVDVLGIPEARSARLSDVAVDLEQAVISDLVEELFGLMR